MRTGLPLSFLSWAYVLEGVYFWVYDMPGVSIFGVSYAKPSHFRCNFRPTWNGRFSVIPGKDVTIENLGYYQTKPTSSKLFHRQTSIQRVYFLCCLLWSPYVIGQTIIFSSCFFLISCFFFFFLSLSQQSEIGCLPYFHTWCGLSANLECRSEMCCTQLAENTGRKKVDKNRHLGTIAQLCWTIYSQLRHVSTIGKKTC